MGEKRERRGKDNGDGKRQRGSLKKKWRVILNQKIFIRWSMLTFNWSEIKLNECFLNGIIIVILHWQNRGNLHRPEECPSFHPLLGGCNP